VIVVLKGPTKTLYCIEPTKPAPHYLKFLSETFEPGDKLMDAVVRALVQEAGMTDVAFKLEASGHIEQICDPRISNVTEIGEPEELPSAEPGETHTRHTVLVEATNDNVIESLGDKTNKTPGEREIIHTFALVPRGISTSRILPQHRPLHNSLLRRQAA
jgi:hypothetical protein